MKSFKKMMAFVLALVMVLAVLPMGAMATETDEIVYNGTESITYKGVTFQRQQGGTYDGLPLFDAEPDHLDEYLDVYMDYIGLDGMVRIGLEKRNDYTLVDTYTISESYADAELAGKTITWEQKNVGKVIPGSPQFSSPEAVQGYSTNFPAQIGVGQTWNKELVAKEGHVVGTEKLYGSGSLGYEGSYLSTANQMVSTALTDMRVNPLSGRIDEGYSEDDYLASVMVDTMAAAVTGHDQAESDDGFWQMAFVDTKHFTNYLAQWQRNYGSFFNSARGLVEHVARSTYKAFSNDHIGCMMTIYGTTNYIPGGMSPMIQYVKSMSSYPISTINDNGAETAPVSRLGNDYMTSYWPRRAEQIISQAFANASAGYQQRTADAQCDDIYATVYAIQSGKMGYTLEDVRVNAEGAIINQIRGGILNERDENGVPKDYPFSDIVYGETVYDYTNEDHQAVSLAMGQESAVLLKNNGVLPLSKDADVVVTGQVADARFTTTYAGTTYAGENMGLTPLGGIMAVTGKTAEELHYTSGAKQVVLKHGEGYIVSDGTVEGTAATGTAEEAAVFDLYAWGQDDAISLLETASNKWLGYSSGGSWWNPTPAGLSMSDDALHLGERSVNDSRGTINASSMPSNMRREYVSDDSFRLLAGTFTGGFFNSFEQSYWTQGVYLMVNEDGTIGITESMGSAENADNIRTEATEFTAEVISEAGANVYTDGDAAIVVIGVSPTFSAGEGTDRIDLDLGAEQYELAHNVAAQYPGNTVVVVKVSSPVGLEALENDENIGAILYQPYAGEYEGLALAQLLFGEANPSGRLANTWYADTEPLPDIDQSIIHNGWVREGVTLEDLDPARDVLMTNGDPYDTGLSYLYNNDPDDVVYEFGYGLSYSDFEIRSMSAPKSVNAGETFQVEVEVANLTDVPGYQVVQLYIAMNDSPYGDAAPIKKLVSFEKVWVPAVTSTTATLTVDPADFAVYTAQDQDLTVLSGEYTLMAGSSSDVIEKTASVTVTGDELAVLDPTERTDVFASAFAADDVYYREYSRQSTIDSLKADKVTEGYYTVVSKWEGSWVAIANVNLYELKSLTAEVGALEGISGTIDIRIGAPDGEKIGTITVPETGAHTYVLEESGNGDNSDIEITELKHVQVEAELEDVSGLGTEDVYFVFNDAELRLASFTAQVSEQPVELPFEDVSEEQWFYDAVDYVYRGGLMNGVSDTRFAPELTTTRGMVVTILWRMEGEPAAETELPFTDVAADAYYAEAIAWAAENGIVNGTSATTFHPDNDVLREQLAAMLYRYADYKGIDTTARADLTAFVDADKISAYAVDAISWANANELIIGIGGNKLAPLDNANRAQIAQLIMNYCEAFGL